MNLKKLFRDSENKLVATNISASLIIKMASLLLSLINTRSYMLYFANDTILGGWYAIVTILNWILYFDLGIGNGMRNGIVAPMENGDYKTVKKYISTGYVVIGLISALIVVVGTILSFFVNWNTVLNLPPETIDNKSLIIMVVVSIIGVGAQFLLKTLNSVFNALRKTAVIGAMVLASNILTFLYLNFVRVGDPVTALIWFSVFYALSSNIPILIVSIIVYSRSLKEVRPSPKYFDKGLSRSISNLGIRFFLIQIALLVISTFDSWLVTFFFSSADTVDYQVYYRFFSIALAVYIQFSQPIWSSVTKYYELRDSKRIKNTYTFLNVIAIIGGACCVILALVFKYFVRLWMYDVEIEIKMSTAVLFALWMFIHMMVNSSTAVANGMGKLRVQEIFTPAASVIKIVCIFVMSRLGFSWDCVVLSSIIGLIPLSIVQHIDIKRELKRLK